MKNIFPLLALIVSVGLVSACSDNNQDNESMNAEPIAPSQMPSDDQGDSQMEMSDSAPDSDAAMSESKMDDSAMSASPGATMAVAELVATQGNEVSGSVNFKKTPEGVAVTGMIEGLTPGEHGFHIHENGDCSSTDGKSAGGHFAPGGQPHGAPDADEHHEGDMGNLSANEEGVAELDEQFDFLEMGDGEASILGKALIVHGGADDLESQPSGDAGARVACGVIKVQGATGINTPQS